MALAEQNVLAGIFTERENNEFSKHTNLLFVRLTGG